MQTVNLLCVGKLKERFYADACAEYQKRLGRYCRLSLTELPEQRLGDAPSDAEVAAALEREADAIFERLPRGGAVIALCVEGRALSSAALAGAMADYATRGVSQLSFLIGGSFGMAERVKRAADLRLSMSAMTFPHHLARVMLLEQIYRAYQIQAGTKYHK
ncbi:MAG: 23S rRNA (pseudouridine(1915)-N(3))-methyltransferase RlmH [Oscillospiraceae bacterium]|nr:23S rRNA (pseudouridine(1915)-N(3))-methyltransferase RlmH [Oscillospiraceae bacterium]